MWKSWKKFQWGRRGPSAGHLPQRTQLQQPPQARAAGAHELRGRLRRAGLQLAPLQLRRLLARCRQQRNGARTPWLGRVRGADGWLVAARGLARECAFGGRERPLRFRLRRDNTLLERQVPAERAVSGSSTAPTQLSFPRPRWTTSVLFTITEAWCALLPAPWTRPPCAAGRWAMPALQSCAAARRAAESQREGPGTQASSALC